jgi:hypothetical protein
VQATSDQFNNITTTVFDTSGRQVATIDRYGH